MEERKKFKSGKEGNNNRKQEINVSYVSELEFI